jgi:uncharacterized protein YdeI (YjbR/CyaY-like superfamily)
MSSPDELRKQKTDLESKIQQTEQMIGRGLSWQDAQFYLQKYNEQIRLLDVQIARLALGEDAVSELKAKKEQLQAKLQSLEQMRKDGTISDKVYKDKKKETEKDIQQVEKDIVDTM